MAASPALLIFADRTRWEWLPAFLGRFHPTVLHFPIALLLLAALLEILQGASRGRWRFPVAFILFCGALGAVLAMALGWHLMATEAVTGVLADRHKQGGIVVAFLAVAALFVRLIPAAETRPVARWSYRGLLLATGLMLVRTSHDGGSLTHGEDYLTEHAPWQKPFSPAPFVFPTDKPVVQWDLYGHVVTPILQARCYECHTARNTKGGLVLDTWAGLQHGGKNGALWLAGKPEKSLLLERMNLPVDHKEHMPPRRKAQPSPEEMALLRRWITLGAPEQGSLGSLKLDNRLLAVVGQLPGLLQSGAPAVEQGPKEIDPADVVKLRADLAAAVVKLQAKYMRVLAYESRQSADLELNASLLGKSFGDADLAAFAPLGAHLVWLDLSGTAITDASAAVLGKMKQLRVLRLVGTGVSDATAPALVGLDHLASLNVYSTAMTPKALTAFAQLHGLQQVYVGQTKIPVDVVCPDALKPKLRFQLPVPLFPAPPVPVVPGVKPI